MIIAITNQKGGVGKTTTAINLAAAFANKGPSNKGLLAMNFGSLKKQFTGPAAAATALALVLSFAPAADLHAAGNKNEDTLTTATSADSTDKTYSMMEAGQASKDQKIIIYYAPGVTGFAKASEKLLLKRGYPAQAMLGTPDAGFRSAVLGDDGCMVFINGRPFGDNDRNIAVFAGHDCDGEMTGRVANVYDHKFGTPAATPNGGHTRLSDP